MTDHFNPRPPWGGRHRDIGNKLYIPTYFNPRPPWGGRRAMLEKAFIVFDISIHALRGEGDGIRFWQITDDKPLFQSTPSVGRATIAARRNIQRLVISIHALRGEGDRHYGDSLFFQFRFQSTPSVGRATCDVIYFTQQYDDFNPRPPWGGRRDCSRV